MKEQNVIFDHLPDGVIIYEEEGDSEDQADVSLAKQIQLRFINVTFHSMFQQYIAEASKRILRNQNFGYDKYGRKVRSFAEPEMEQPGEQTKESKEKRKIEYELQLLDNIYLQKTCYKITANGIEHVDDFIDNPQSLLESLQNIESGKVYEIMY
jgi:hypothetical protein